MEYQNDYHHQIKLKEVEPDFLGQCMLQNTKSTHQNTKRNNFKADII
jgi:hypothetical protein